MSRSSERKVSTHAKKDAWEQSGAWVMIGYEVVE